MTPDKPAAVELIEERLVHESPYVRVYDDRVRFPSGHEGTQFRFRWKAPYGVVALPVLEDGSIALVEVYRHGDRRWRLEAPRGFGDAGLTPAQAVAREAREELGFSATETIALRTLGGTDYPLHLFELRGRLDALQEAGADEALGRVHVFGPDDLADLLGDPRIGDAETLFLIARRLSLPR